jgi:hypothetical protein
MKFLSNLVQLRLVNMKKFQERDRRIGREHYGCVPDNVVRIYLENVGFTNNMTIASLVKNVNNLKRLKLLRVDGLSKFFYYHNKIFKRLGS